MARWENERVSVSEHHEMELKVWCECTRLMIDGCIFFLLKNQR